MNSPPDGYTLLINTIPFVTNQFLMPRVPYDPLRDFVAISLVASSPSLVTVHPSLPARSVQELHRARQGEAGPAHLLRRRRRHQSAHRRRTFQPAGGRRYRRRAVQGRRSRRHGGHRRRGGRSRSATFRRRSATSKAGRLRALAVTSAKRNAAMPELPTVAEAGVPGYEFDTWFVVVAPKGTPRAIVDTLNSHIRKVLTTPGAGEVLRGARADGHREHARGGRRAPRKRAEEMGARHQGARHQGGVMTANDPDFFSRRPFLCQRSRAELSLAGDHHHRADPAGRRARHHHPGDRGEARASRSASQSSSRTASRERQHRAAEVAGRRPTATRSGSPRTARS